MFAVVGRHDLIMDAGRGRFVRHHGCLQKFFWRLISRGWIIVVSIAGHPIPQSGLLLIRAPSIADAVLAQPFLAR
jgi:hypothetical protein